MERVYINSAPPVTFQANQECRVEFIYVFRSDKQFLRGTLEMVRRRMCATDEL